ncbi:MAG TPA: helix-turn-helix transcriptional regulator [Gemmataceae bacterium]|nr:helix-turn-helix transcriptional regulator [Gemmataceae bacterium]
MMTETLGARLRRLRLAAGLKQHALAVRTGLTREAISMLETGRRGRRPAADTVVRLAAALGVPPGELAGTK